MKLILGLLLMVYFPGIKPIGQKYRVIGRDTIPLTTTNSIPCNTFEKANGRIINVTDGQCESQGLWIIKDSTGAYRTGNFKDDHETGTWRYFDKEGKLIRETESITVSKDTYLVKDIEYINGVPKVHVNKPFIGFFLKILWGYFIVMMLAFFSRVFINSRIYNIENETDLSPMYFHIGPAVTNNFSHSIQCIFSFWFSNYKPENRKRVLLSNILSLISLVMFFSAMIILGSQVK